MTFQDFFSTATGGNQAYAYQRRLAEDSACQSRLIKIPTDLDEEAQFRADIQACTLANSTSGGDSDA